MWELLETLRSRWAVDFSGNCVPAVKKVRELSSPAFPLKLRHELAFILSCQECNHWIPWPPKTWEDTKIALLPYVMPKIL